MLCLLNRLFENDPFIDEIGLLYNDNETYNSDTIEENQIVLNNHKLGISIIGMKQLYKEATEMFWKIEKNQFNLKSETELELEYLKMLSCTRGILLVNPDFYTAWNRRKKLVILLKIQEMDEMKLCNLILTNNAKSIDTWAHKRWLFKRILDNNKLTDAFIKKETLFCQTLAEQYPRNYHAWSYRQLIYDNVKSLYLLQDEYELCKSWNHMHISDYSSWNHRSQIIYFIQRFKSLNDEVSDLNLIEMELKTLEKKYITKYYNRQSLWYFRRAILCQNKLLKSKKIVIINKS